MLMVPGVTGCSNDTYLKVIATSLIKSGILPIVVNYRGLGGVKLKTPKLYCFGSYNDIDEAFEHLFAKHRDNTFYALGVSQGASILTNYLGKKSKECSKIKCAACIATPYDLILVDALASYPLQRLLGIVCKGVVEQHLGERMLFDEKYLNEVMPKIKTAREYNQYIVVPQFGYKTVNEYLRKESCVSNIANIQVPTLFFSALDDPLTPKSIIPFEEIKVNHHTMLATLPFGGHACFYENCKATSFTGEIISDFMRSVDKSSSLLD